MFSAPAVRALLSGRKTQTRLLAHKLRKARLQRAGAPDAIRLTPSSWRDTNVGDRFWVRESLGWDKGGERLFYRADGGPVLGAPPPGEAISEEDAVAEGLRKLPDGRYMADDFDSETYASAAVGYAYRWSGFHSRKGTRWEDDPEVVVVDFRLERCDVASQRARSRS